MFGKENPYDGNQAGHITVLRVQPGQPIRGTLVGSPIKCWVHFHHGKSLPCTKTDRVDCPLCECECTRRYYAWYPIRGKSRQLALLELTASAEEELLSQARDAEPNELVRITASRMDQRRNSPIRVKAVAERVDKDVYDAWWERTPSMEEFQSVLLTLWSVPHPKTNEPLEDWLDRVGRNIRGRIQ